MCIRDRANVIYVLDPDQNILELIDHTMEEIVALTLVDHPESDPNYKEQAS